MRSFTYKDLELRGRPLGSRFHAALLGPSLSVPFVGGRLTLGTWQQIILIDFDTRPRQREVVAQMMGE